MNSTSFNLCLASLLLSVTSWASSTGQTNNCNNCHGGGATPTVTVQGQSEIFAGSKGNSFSVTITGGAAAVGGFFVSAGNSSAVLNAGSGQRRAGAALTHSTPKAFSGNSVTFDFTLDAPFSEGSFDLTVRGNSANNNGQPSGDAAASTVFPVLVKVAAVEDAGVDAGQPPTPDAGPVIADAGIDAGPTPSSDAGPVIADAGTDTNGNKGPNTPAPETEEPEEKVPARGCQSTSASLFGSLLLSLWSVSRLRQNSRRLKLSADFKK